MKAKCLIVDDEPLAVQLLKKYVDDLDNLVLSATCTSAIEASSFLMLNPVDLVFLDIQMPKITGLDFFKSLQQAPPVIFTTAYPQYALDGFELKALDYLVKPISFDRFLKAALKAKEYYELRQQNKQVQSEAAAQKDFFIKADNQLVRISFDEL